MMTLMTARQGRLPGMALRDRVKEAVEFLQNYCGILKPLHSGIKTILVLSLWEGMHDLFNAQKGARGNGW